MGERENTQLVRQAYRDFQNGDVPALLDALSEDVEWFVPEVEGVPGRGTWRGPGQVGEFFRILSETQESRGFELREFVAQGADVVVLGHYVWHVKATGKGRASDFVHALSVRDGKVTRFQEYTDTAVFGDAFREG